MIQLPVSSIQLNILRIIKKKKVNYNNFFKYYSDSNIFEIRLKRLIKSKVILFKKKKLFINKKNILLILNFFLFLRKITNQNK
jgi:hypothetical protein